jgi:hypothetical protein
MDPEDRGVEMEMAQIEPTMEHMPRKSRQEGVSSCPKPTMSYLT